MKAQETEVIAFSSRGKSDTEKTQQLLTPDFSLVPGPQIDIMKSYGVFNDEKKVAKPAAFIVDKKGILRWRYVGKDNYDRPNPAALIEKIGNMKQP